MKKAIFASMLAAASASAPFCLAQTPVNINQGQQGGAATGGQVQLSQPEYNAYNNVITATDPAAKAAAGETFLQQFPQSSVKQAVLEQMVAAYSTTNPQKALDTSDKLLQVDPNNIRALVVETSILKGQGDTATDTTQKQSLYDKAADFASRGLKAPKPASVSDADWATLQKQVTPYLYSAIGIDALTKKDPAGAITAYKTELQSVPVEQTQTPGPFLQDTYFLAQAYYQSTPPDYLNCTFFATRTVAYAPDQFKPQFQPLATYCYKKYHGSADGYDAVQTAAKASLMPSADYATSIKPAPTAADQATTVLEADKKDDPTLAKANLADREFVMQNGTAEQAEAEFAPIKGKELKLSGVVVSVSGTALQLAVSDDAKASTPKVADVAVTLKEAPKTAPAVDAPVTVVGMVDSYTQKPLLITMTGGEIEAKAATRAPSARRPAPRRR